MNEQLTHLKGAIYDAIYERYADNRLSFYGDDEDGRDIYFDDIHFDGMVADTQGFCYNCIAHVDPGDHDNPPYVSGYTYVEIIEVEIFTEDGDSIRKLTREEISELDLTFRFDW